MRVHVGAAWLAAAVALSGCELDDSDVHVDILVPDADAAPEECDPEIRVGTGVREFVPVTDGDTVYLYRGPQGGYMIYLSVHGRGLDPSDVNVCYSERFRDDGELVGEGCWRVRLGNDLGAGWFERVGIWGEIEPELWATPRLVRGQDINMNVTLTDKRGCSASGGWWVHIHEDPGM